MSEIIHLTAESFEDATKGDKPVLVDFWAEWCAPCRAIAPILTDMASTDQRLQIAKLDVDEHPSIPRKLGIKSIPTLILFSGGQERERWVGLRNKDQLLREVEPHLARVGSGGDAAAAGQ